MVRYSSTSVQMNDVALCTCWWCCWRKVFRPYCTRTVNFFYSCYACNIFMQFIRYTDLFFIIFDVDVLRKWNNFLRTFLRFTNKYIMYFHHSNSEFFAEKTISVRRSRFFPSNQSTTIVVGESIVSILQIRFRCSKEIYLKGVWVFMSSWSRHSSNTSRFYKYSILAFSSCCCIMLFVYEKSIQSPLPPDSVLTVDKEETNNDASVNRKSHRQIEFFI